MRMPNLSLCAITLVWLMATAVAQAQTLGLGNYADPPYFSTVETLLPDGAPGNTALPRPLAAIGTFTLDLMVLKRSRMDPFTLVTVDGVDVLDASTFDFDETGAMRFTATLPGQDGVDLEFSYLGSHEFSAAAAFTGGSVEDQFFQIVAPVTELGIVYEAPLDSFEINTRVHHWERFSPLIGVRYTSLNESSLQTDITNGLDFWGSAKNSLTGIQIGGQTLWAQTGPWRLESDIKAGVYYNDMNIEALAATVDFNRKFSTTAFLGEVRLTLIYQFSSHGSLRFGYQGLWMEGTALLYDQYDNFHYTNGNGSVDLGSVNFQGGFAGFDLTW